jgi:hypothetical protein
MNDQDRERIQKMRAFVEKHFDKYFILVVFGVFVICAFANRC